MRISDWSSDVCSSDLLAAAIYKQGEAARDAGDMKTASQQFLRVGQVTPTAKIRATAEYDGAAALIALQDWPQAARVLENFRSLFPGTPLAAAYDQHHGRASPNDTNTKQHAQTLCRTPRT